MIDHKAELRRSLTNPVALCKALNLTQGAISQHHGILICCPWHTDKAPSCSVTLGQDNTIRVKCFGCDKAGDAFHLIAVVHGLDLKRDFSKILQIAADIANRKDLLKESKTPLPQARPTHIKPLYNGTYHAIVSRLLELCPLKGDVADYMAQRHLLEPAMAEGWGALPWDRKEKKQLIETLQAEFGEEQLYQASLVAPNTDNFIKPYHRLLIPYRKDGEIHYLLRRRIDERADGRYTGPANRSVLWPYGVDAISPEHEELFIVEGAIDVLACREIIKKEGLNDAVIGMSGIQAWRSEWAQYGKCRNVTIGFDADQDNDNAQNNKKRIAAALKAAGAIKTFDYHHKHGKDWAAQWTYEQTGQK